MSDGYLDTDPLLLLSLVVPPLSFVGYEPPAGGPAVDEGEVSVIHELFG